MKMKMHWLRTELLKIRNLFLQSFQQLKVFNLKMKTWTILVSPDAYEHMSILPFSRLDFYGIFLTFFFGFLFFFTGDSDLHPNGAKNDGDGVQNCTFTELLSTGQFLSESMYFFFRYCDTPVIMLAVCY
ncbi:hypothetical protein HanRHA438_Chr07g0297731 [Helianthus annuus]|nr:hypothetical protein HanHA300_Chr07g0236031 [Helianthus annuus]KAJ0562587.1 hypothetical protein HanHA89_Chr07g0253211 [Helianthus annuus]KAJ0727962.1 hypothetical protein HanLR1_Chr07g0235971 [Helianthus annuus]KAJ0904098.1 hypothetical protein HanPSC8_Chr07g0277931 [Helianthus annuus]KAJ0907337.1 hypothetical protein HanRHA438_Chr07g0297731 [Helianthus annuus]